MGSPIKALQHNWFPISYNSNTNARSSYLSNDTRVADLTDTEKKTWNIQLLSQYFNPDQIKEIMTIKIPSKGEDTLRWSLPYCGAFTTKYVYNELSKNNAGISHLHQMEGKGWLKLWNMEVPHKIQMFL